MPKLPLKKTERLAEREALGATLGTQKAIARWRRTKVGMQAEFIDFLKQHVKDIPEWIAVIGCTIAFKHVITTVVELNNAVQNMFTLISTGKTLTIPLQLMWGLVGNLTNVAQGTVSELKSLTATELKKPMHVEWFEWLIAFTLAYIFVKHAGQIAIAVGEGFKGLQGFASMMLGAVA